MKAVNYMNSNVHRGWDLYSKKNLYMGFSFRSRESSCLVNLATIDPMEALLFVLSQMENHMLMELATSLKGMLLNQVQTLEEWDW